MITKILGIMWAKISQSKNWRKSKKQVFLSYSAFFLFFGSLVAERSMEH